ncbi:carboxymuconolactone decarboxylase family protein [Kitasatospora sp. NBC_01560]|uniref:carboxymuconolactone decarboxylase family protein n=1 Tax=Kitasatospora sp. NBC_01560 TaxID=2975965 RepID=UPI00386710F9
MDDATMEDAMTRMPQLTPETAGVEQRDLLEATRRQLGRVPNLYASLANGPAALRGYLALRDSLAGGVLTERLREQLALLVAQENGCTYCVSAHTLRGGRLLRMTDDELLATRRAEDADPHARAVLRVAAAVVRSRGRVDDELLDRARQDGVTDAELAEIVAHVALNTLSNYFNHLAEPELDFPAVDPAVDPEALPVADAGAVR